MSVSFDDLREANLHRLEDSFHALEDMDGLQWGACASGELGEALNKQKKLWRLEHIAQLRGAVLQLAMIENVHDVVREIADCVVYADLWAARLGESLGDAVREVFNDKSLEVQSHIFLGVSNPAPPPPLPAPIVRTQLVCGASHPDADVERRINAMRDHEVGCEPPGRWQGCGISLVWTYAYRCVECGRWLHRECARRHFGVTAELIAEVQS